MMLVTLDASATAVAVAAAAAAAAAADAAARYEEIRVSTARVPGAN